MTQRRTPPQKKPSVLCPQCGEKKFAKFFKNVPQGHKQWTQAERKAKAGNPDIWCARCRSKKRAIEVLALKHGADEAVAAAEQAETKAALDVEKEALERDAFKVSKERIAEFKIELRRQLDSEKSARSKISVNKERAMRELSRRHLLPFICRTNVDYDPGWFHELMCLELEDFLDQVEKGLSPRLMLMVPPRGGKSEIVSRKFPAWVLGKHPDWDIIETSYAASLAEGFSKDVRELLRSDGYHALFPNTALSKDSQGVQEWRTTDNGQYTTAGVGGPILGKGAHIFIIDDPLKNEEEADSELRRETIFNWMGSTAQTRLAPGGGVLIIMQRWHDDDLCGRILRETDIQRKEANETLIDAQEALRAEYKKAQVLLNVLPKFSERTRAQKERMGRAIDEVQAADDVVRQCRDELAAVENWRVVKFSALAEGFTEYLDGARNVVRVPKGEALDEEKYTYVDVDSIPDRDPNMTHIDRAMARFNNPLMSFRNVEGLPEGKTAIRLLRRDGDALHPARYDRRALLRIKKSPATQPRHWNALYQQAPVPDSGDFFNRDMFVFQAPQPKHILREGFVFQTWDLAIGLKQANDWTVGISFRLMPDGLCYVEEMVRGRWNTFKIADQIVGLAIRHNPAVIGVEQGQLSMAIMPVVVALMQKKKRHFSFTEALKPVTDKMLRARPLQGQLEQHAYRFPPPETHPWVTTLINELLRFPVGLNDDIVDTMAWGGRILADTPPPLAAGARRRKQKTVSQKVRDYARAQRGSNQSDGYMGS